MIISCEVLTSKHSSHNCTNHPRNPGSWFPLKIISEKPWERSCLPCSLLKLQIEVLVDVASFELERKLCPQFYRDWFFSSLYLLSSFNSSFSFFNSLSFVSFLFLSFTLYFPFLYSFSSLSLLLTFVFLFFSFLSSEMKLWIDNLGCYVDKGVEAWKDPSIRAIDTLYKNLRKPGRIEWSFGHFLQVIMECAQTAQARGYACFGIEFYGECWGSYNACQTYNRYGNSSRCTLGVGTYWALYVYKAKCGSGKLLL